MQSDRENTVFIVDDDPDSLDSVCALVSTHGFTPQAFASAEEFLQDYRGQSGCLVTDLRLPNMNGLELQETLARRGCPLPVIIITAFAQTPSTVQAIQRGAVTLLDKPYLADDLLKAIRTALAIAVEERAKLDRSRALVARLATMTHEQRKVLDLIVAGKPNKVIAHTLGIGLRTVESRRREIFQAMRVKSLAELVRVVMEAGHPGVAADSAD